MTSFVIKAHENRVLPAAWNTAPDCPFCRIVRGESQSYALYEDDMILAILDIMPLRFGHTLVIPKTHVSRVSELPDEFAAQCGIAVSKVARAISGALQNTALNVVCNQEYAQAVPHVHYHIIPAPRPDDAPAPALASMPVPGPDTQAGPPQLPDVVADPREARDRVAQPLTEKEMHRREYELRNTLEEDDARRLMASVRALLGVAPQKL
ncbi:HIT-like protein [Lentinus tigrinus ALCF2SS1-7]|uniref:HIT-like protein n=1 Tax=Lentinus tigrinus ALCF2SS1-6 TaxID=1328759 RepID=A0A5C2SGS9_9APHY|nr:HIT-like protein [Lentinus tigrinus ALCF2SS1-6]RPD77745.1 HIT-like protein [Lentinus tigrinus ALCF2SS1-7]